MSAYEAKEKFNVKLEVCCQGRKSKAFFNFSNKKFRQIRKNSSKFAEKDPQEFANLIHTNLFLICLHKPPQNWIIYLTQGNFLKVQGLVNSS